MLFFSDARDIMNGHRARVFAIQYHPHFSNAFISGGWDDTVQVGNSLGRQGFGRDVGGCTRLKYSRSSTIHISLMYLYLVDVMTPFRLAKKDFYLFPFSQENLNIVFMAQASKQFYGPLPIYFSSKLQMNLFETKPHCQPTIFRIIVEQSSILFVISCHIRNGFTFDIGMNVFSFLI